MQSIFKGLYTLIVIRFLRSMFSKLCPVTELDESLPRYLILAMFSDRGMLLGYTDDYSVINEYDKETSWTITVSEYDGQYYMAEDRDGYNVSAMTWLTSLYEQENRGSADRDARLAAKFGFRKEKIEYLVKRYKNGNYA